MGCNCCGKPTYAASFTGLDVGVIIGSPIAELIGSATRKVRLLKMVISGTADTAFDLDLQLIKESSPSTGGTSTTATAVPLDSEFSPATAVFKGYTVSPTPGTPVGTIASAVLSLALAPAIVPAPIMFDFSRLPILERPTLHTDQECLMLDLGTASDHTSLDIYAWWTEEPLNT